MKKAFNEAFGGQMSAVLTRLMRQAVAELRRAQRRATAVDAMLRLRRRQRPVTDRELRRARRAGRP